MIMCSHIQDKGLQNYPLCMCGLFTQDQLRDSHDKRFKHHDNVCYVGGAGWEGWLRIRWLATSWPADVGRAAGTMAQQHQSQIRLQRHRGGGANRAYFGDFTSVSVFIVIFLQLHSSTVFMSIFHQILILFLTHICQVSLLPSKHYAGLEQNQQ